MGAGGVAGKGQAEAGAGCVLRACLIKARKGAEGLLIALLRNAGTIVVDMHFRRMRAINERHLHVAAIHHGVRHEIGQGPFQGQPSPADPSNGQPFDPSQRQQAPLESPRTPAQEKLRQLEEEARRLRQSQLRGRARDTSRMPSGQDW